MIADSLILCASSNSNKIKRSSTFLLKNNFASLLLLFVLQLILIKNNVHSFTMTPALVYSPSVLPLAASETDMEELLLDAPETTVTITTSTATATAPTTTFSVAKEQSLAHHLGVENVDVIDFFESEYQPVVVGHRGALYEALENTRESFDRCADLGCAAVELDVFLLKCGTLIVFHGGGSDQNPGALEDYCNTQGGILDLTYEQALQLNFNTEFAEFGCPAESIQRGRIPTLEEVLLDAKKSGLFIKIELKGPGTVEPTLEVVERLQMTSQCSYASFDLPRLKHLRQLRPDSKRYPSGALFDEVPADYIQQAKDCGASEIHLKYSTCTKARVEEIHAAGFGSMLWMRGPIGMALDTSQRFLDVGNEDELMYLVLMMTGVQQLCVNRPDVILNWNRQRLIKQQ